MNDKVRVRFAPSPTGPLHIGGVRTALYNYLFAKHNNGTFILRIEDTDQTRYVPGAEEYIIESLKWSGIEPDEGLNYGGDYGPYRQSERKPIYHKYVQKLLETGHAYYAFDTPVELTAMRERLTAAKVAAPQYNAVTRTSMKNSLSLSSDQVSKLLNDGVPYVVRLHVPRNEEIRFHDEIRGWVVVNTANIDDKVLSKSDGMPTYHMANIVDDHLMGITHVIRGEEWLPSAPVHVLLYRYLGWEEEMPKFSHLPLILKPDGNGKLSKRDGDRLGFPVFPLDWKDPTSGEKISGYRENGYFPDAFINMLAFLGWNPGTEKEMFSVQELADAFTLDRVGKAGAKFDVDKAHWYNQQYLRMKSDTVLAELLLPLLHKKNIQADLSYVASVCKLMKERAHFIVDMMEGIYFFIAPTSYDDKTIRKKWKENTPGIMLHWLNFLEEIDVFTVENIDAGFHTFIEQEGVGAGSVLANFRILVTGKGMGPSMFETAAILGKEETIRRIKIGIEIVVNSFQNDREN